MKVIIAGSRGITNKRMIYEKLDRMINRYPDIEIVSGCAKGPDDIAISFAEDRVIPLHKYPANWEKYGKRAGYIRNEEMARVSDVLVAFWDCESRGTKHMIRLAIDYGLKVKVLNEKGEIVKINKDSL